MHTTTPALVGAREVAERLDVTVGTVNRWVRTGRIPCVRPSRRIVRFDMDAVLAAFSKEATNGNH